jgi:GH24 family phage-related lysozyme (muramidase)
MGYGSSEEYEDFMDNVQDFEESLVVDGDYLFKLWFSIDKETQAKRFDFRQKSPLKYWKYSENDEKMQDVWEKFTEYKQKLFDKTSTVNHPWVVLDSNDKKISGLNSIRYVLQNIPYTNKDEDVLNKDFPEAMTVLKPNINEQSFVDAYNQLSGKSQQKQEPNFMDTWSSMGKPKDQMKPDSGGVVSDINKTIKSGLETAKKSLDKKSSNSSDSYATRCSTRAIDYIKKQEGFRPEPYKDTNGILTIGYGQIKINGRPVRPGDIITEPEASKKVNDYVKNTVEPEILSYGGGHNKLTQHQFDALCSLKYNFGGYAKSDLKKAIQINPNPNRNTEIEKHFTTGWKDGELIKRRKHEYGLYSKGDYTTYNQA